MPLRWKAAEFNPLEGTDLPKLHQSMPHCVFYLYGRDPKTGEIVGPHGTGVFVARKSKRNLGENHVYAVTNWHVACRGSSIIGINRSDSVRRFLEFDPSEWHFTGKGDDIAAIDITDHQETHDLVVTIHEEMFVTPEVIEQFEIGPGEDTFMCGLFASHPGVTANVPAFRFGNISVLADVVAPVEVETGARRPCYLVDTRSRTGFSGSPVFSYRTVAGNLEAMPVTWKRDTKRGGIVSIGSVYDNFMGLLGIHCGQFWDTVKAFKTSAHKAERLGEPLQDGDELDIQSSMTIVAPAWCISETLDLEVFEVARKKRDEDREGAARRRPRPESAAPQATDANPTHREDFTRLVGAAARKPPQED